MSLSFVTKHGTGPRYYSGTAAAYGFARNDYKKGAFSWPSEDQEQVRVSLSHEELALLLGGIEVGRTRRKNWYRKELLPNEKVEEKAGD
jgi:hypothetical protein